MHLIPHTSCTSEFENLESLGYLPYKFRLSDRRTVQKLGYASQEKQERQKISECQSICNMKKFPRALLAHPIFCSRFISGELSQGKSLYEISSINCLQYAISFTFLMVMNKMCLISFDIFLTKTLNSF
jgi:hypothetical protein